MKRRIRRLLVPTSGGAPRVAGVTANLPGGTPRVGVVKLALQTETTALAAAVADTPDQIGQVPVRV